MRLFRENRRLLASPRVKMTGDHDTTSQSYHIVYTFYASNFSYFFHALG